MTTSLIAPTPVTAPAARPAPEVTGSVKPPLNIASPAAQAALPEPDPAAVSAPVAAPAAAPLPAAMANLAEKLPVSIGGPALRMAGAAGNPAAEYEIGVRFAEGRGVPANMELAVAVA